MGTSLHPSVQVALKEAARSTGEAETIIVLPTRLVDGVPTYSEFDTFSVNNAREAGVDARFLTSQRRYLSERNADFMAAVGMGLAAELTASMIGKAARYVRAQIRGAIQRGLAESEASIQLKITVGLVEAGPDGSLRIEDLSIEANGATAVQQVTDALESRLRTRKSIEG